MLGIVVPRPPLHAQAGIVSLIDYAPTSAARLFEYFVMRDGRLDHVDLLSEEDSSFSEYKIGAVAGAKNTTELMQYEVKGK